MLAIRPPEYFPRLEYIALIQHVDHFVLADTFPYSQESFQDRSKVRNAQGWHWITIPLFGNPAGRPLRDVEIETGGRWQEKHWRSFLYNYRTTMYFEFFEAEFRPFFERTWESLASCTSRSVEVLAELFGFQKNISRASALDGAPDGIPEILEATGAETLVVSEDRRLPSTPEISEVRRFAYESPTYHQNFEGFEPGMTAADLVFNYGPEARSILAQGMSSTSLSENGA